jgi:hypothetical protein
MYTAKPLNIIDAKDIYGGFIINIHLKDLLYPVFLI